MANELQERLGLIGGLSALFEGPPGSGKSHAAGSIAEFGPTEVHCFLPKETSSNLYTSHPNIRDVKLFHDPKWSPSVDSYEASAYLDWVKHVHRLMDNDEIENVILDPLSALNTSIRRGVLKKEDAARMNDMSDPRGAWGDFRELWEEALTAAIGLTHAPTPKNVIATVHAQLPSEEESQKKGIEYMGDTRPAIQGSFRDLLEAHFQIVCHTRVVQEFDQKKREQVSEYKVEVRADNKRHSKVAIAPALDVKMTDNDFGAIAEAIEEAQSQSA